MRSPQFGILLAVSLTVLGLALAEDPPKKEKEAKEVPETLLPFKGAVEKVKLDGKNGYVAIFKGIPYADKPERFTRAELKAPTPVKEEDKEIGALKFGKACPQPAFRDVVADDTSEDCLSLNIYVPYDKEASDGILSNTLEKKSYPVYVFIHGGGYQRLQSKNIDPSSLTALGEVIVVTFNYRLGPLGFMSTDTDDIPANLGLSDQQLAIKWVKEYIGEFGGDKKAITLGGQSAGSYSAIFQAINVENKDLFRSVVAESGTPVSPGSIAPKGFPIASAVAKAVGCEIIDNAEKIKECLMEKPVEELVNAEFPSVSGNQLPYTPVYDPAAFEADIKSEHFRRKNLLIGYNDEDGKVVTNIFVNQLLAKKNVFRSYDNYTEEVQSLKKDVGLLETMIATFLISPKNALDVQITLDQYADWENLDSQDVSMLQFVTDGVFGVPSIQTALEHSYRAEEEKKGTDSPTTTAKPEVISQDPAAEDKEEEEEDDDEKDDKEPRKDPAVDPGTATSARRRRREAEKAAKKEKETSQSGKTFVYYFNPLPDQPAQAVSKHAGEIGYFFGQVNKLTEGNPGEQVLRAREALASRCIKFVSQFIKSGTPGKLGDVDPTPFTNKQRSFVEISEYLEPKVNPSADAFHFWTNILPKVQATEARVKELENRPAPEPAKCKPNAGDLSGGFGVKSLVMAVTIAVLSSLALKL